MKLSLDEHIGPVLAIAVVQVVLLAISFMFGPGIAWCILIPVPQVLGHLVGLGVKASLFLLVMQLVAYPVVFGLGLAGQRGWRLAAVLLLIAHVVAFVLCWVGGPRFTG